MESLAEPIVDESELSSADGQDEMDFFQTRNRASSESSNLRSFLDSPLDNLCDYTRWPLLSKLFIELNTPLSASAACERLFSTGGEARGVRGHAPPENFEI